MLQSAQRANEAAVALEAKNPGRPDLIEMQIAWSGKVLAAQKSLHPTGTERKKALEDHLEEAKARAERIHRIPHGVTTDLVTAQADYALAEAEYLQAGEKQP